MKTLKIMFAVILLMVTGCDGNNPTSIGPLTFSVKGKVVDTDGNPIEDVAVEFNDSRKAVTDENGEFRLKEFNAGHYKIRLVNPAYEQIYQDITIDHDVYLNYTLLAQYYTVTCVVYHYDDLVENAKIYNDGELKGSTNSNGKFVMTDVTPGYHVISAEHPLYDTEVQAQHIDMNLKLVFNM